MEIKDVTSKNEWENFVQSHEEANFLQSWQWGEFHKERGKKILRRGIYKKDKLIGVYTGQVENARRGKRIEIAGGPIIDWDDNSVVSITTEDIRNQAKLANAVFARIRPQLPYSKKAEKILENKGYKKAPMYLSVELAGVLDLNNSEEEILKGMRQRLRRALRKAAKNSITVETSTNPSDIDTFYDIQLQTAKRHDFVAFNREFLKKQFKAFTSEGQAVLYTAKYNDEILAQNFMIFYGNEASYHYGVSTALGTKLSGAPLLHMQAMKDARDRGIKRYNFWGIVAENDTDHRFYGVSVFKRGFGVEELQYTPAYDLVIDSKKYAGTWLIETARRKIRKV